MKSLIIILTLLFAGIVMAQVPPPSVAPSDSPAIVASVNGASSFLELHKGILVTGIAILSEAIMRAWPTVKPLSWLSLLASIFISIGLLLAKLGALFNNVVEAENAKNPPQAPAA